MKKTGISILCALLAGLLLLSCTSCEPRIGADELSSGKGRQTEAVGKTSEDFPAAMADFSMALFRGLVTRDSENDLISPLSAVLCLALIANGTDGNTRTQLETAFGMDVDTLNESLYAFTSSLYRADDCKLNLANSIWFRDEKNRLHVNEEFLQTNSDWYGAQVYAAPFDDSTLNDINNWCRKYTDGMIEKMIDRLPADAVMYLINALTFDAKWADEYEKTDVDEGTFTDYDKKETTVQMLSSTEGVYFSAENVTGFAKKYAESRYCLVGLLPKEGTDLYDFIGSLNGETWQNLWNTRKSAAVRVKMPEFSYSTSMKLNDTLMAMGITDLFDGNADLSKLGYSEAGKLVVSEVCQKTFIEVSRNGTKAAAITWGGVKDGCAIFDEGYYTVILDRPFVYAIVDCETGFPLFLGAVSRL